MALQKTLSLVTFLALGCQASPDMLDAEPEDGFRAALETCEFTNEDDSPDEFDPDRDKDYIFSDARNFPAGDDVEDDFWLSKSYVAIATSEDPYYRKLAYVDKVSFPYDRSWYMWLSPDDDTGRFSAYVYMKGGRDWDDDIEWFKFKIKMTHATTYVCRSKSRTVWVDD